MRRTGLLVPVLSFSMMKLVREVIIVSASLILGYVVSAFLLVPSFLILWLFWDWNAAAHLVPLFWAVFGLVFALLIWNET